MQNGTIVTSAGVYTDVFVAANGCDSAIVLTITMQSSDSGAVTYFGCNEYTYGDSTYLVSTTVDDTLTASNGCDSIVTVTIDIDGASASSAEFASACNSYTAGDGTVYTTSQVFTDNATNQNGCDSIVLVTLTITNSQNTMDVVECGTEYYTPSGDTLTTAGMYMDTIAGLMGCDSILTINLSFGTSTNDVDSIHSCTAAYNWAGGTETTAGTYSYTHTNAAGCDSVETIILTFGTASAVTVNQVSELGHWVDYNGDTITVTDVYDYLYVNADGCDSLVTASVTITPCVIGCMDATACNYDASATCDDGSCDLPNGCDDPLYLEYDASVTCPDTNACITLIVNGCMDATACNYDSTANVDDGSCDLPNGCDDPLYLEYDASVTCPDNANACITLIVEGCTDPAATNYNPLANVDDGSCEYVTGINETLNNVSVYPNPTNGNVTVDLGGLTDVSIKVINLIGEVIYEDHKISNSTYNIYIEESAGIYFVEISNENIKEVVKLLVK
jgi:hypothetical protein